MWRYLYLPMWDKELLQEIYKKELAAIIIFRKMNSS